MGWRDFQSCCEKEVLKGSTSWQVPRLLKVRLFGAPNRQAIVMLRWAQLLYATGHKHLANVAFARLAKRYGVYVGQYAEIGPGLKLPHPTSIVIGEGVTLGRRVRLFQQTTIAGAPKDSSGLVPRVGDDVTIYPGAKIVGDGCVGNNVVIGANAVVTEAFGDNLVVAGVPATVISRRDTNAETRAKAALHMA